MKVSLSRKKLTDRVHSAWTWRNGAIAIVPLLAVAGIAALLMRHEENAVVAPLPTVKVAAPLVREVDQWDQYVGRFTPSQTVQVRARVSGAITAIHFRDGQMVEKGDRLFTIDQRPYLSALAESQAEVASAESAITLARSDYQRALQLQEKRAIAASEVDALRARLLASEAALAGAKARIRARKLDLEFTDVTAPISGRISDRRIDVGNLVSGGEEATATLLTTINALDPIYFSFETSEASYLRTKRLSADSAAAVEIKLQDEPGYRWQGRVDFTDNGIDLRSGTIRGRAVVSNPGLVLTPGLFGNMRMASSRGNALLIPETAIQSDQAGKGVLVVGPDEVVGIRTVLLGPTVEGLRVITSGLTPDDRVVIGGAPTILPGAKVRAQSESIQIPAQSEQPEWLPSTSTEATLSSN